LRPTMLRSARNLPGAAALAIWEEMLPQRQLSLRTRKSWHPLRPQRRSAVGLPRS